MLRRRATARPSGRRSDTARRQRTCAIALPCFHPSPMPACCPLCNLHATLTRRTNTDSDGEPYASKCVSTTDAFCIYDISMCMCVCVCARALVSAALRGNESGPCACARPRACSAEPHQIRMILSFGVALEAPTRHAQTLSRTNPHQAVVVASVPRPLLQRRRLQLLALLTLKPSAPLVER